ncbi:serum response factor core complexed with specific Sre Dna, partial [Globomyces pollinis-pini]
MNTDLKPTIPEDQQTLTQPAKKTRGKQKIPIEFISNKSRRSITFYKRKSGLIKKAQELNELTKCQVLLLMASETDHIYSYASDNLQPIITNPECQEFIRSCID